MPCSPTSNQPPKEWYFCPSCGVVGFHVVSTNCTDLKCDRLHSDDLLYCAVCGKLMDGGEFSDDLSRTAGH